MGALVKKQTERLLRRQKRFKRWLALFLCLALLVTSGVFTALRMDGQAMDSEGQTEETQDCGLNMHAHGEECYDADGNLICGTPVLEEHIHGEECFAETETGNGDALVEEMPGEPADASVGAENWQEAGESLSLEDLEELPEDETGEAVWQDEGMDKLRGFVNSSWTFDAYYVNEDSRYDVTKAGENGDFNLKYQMEFHTDTDIPAGQVEVRVPAVLLQYRGAEQENITKPAGEMILPTDIAVPFGQSVEDYTYSRSTPFNCRIEGEGWDAQLVFFNYKNITAGSNAAWQVLYKNLQMMEIIDGQEWFLQPQITVGTEEEGETRETQPLTGRVDSSVSLDSLSKTLYKDYRRKYTPGLYTEAQVETYIQGALPEKYQGDNFHNYRYAVWDVKVKGSASQPWNLKIREQPYFSGSQGYGGGEAVGFLDNSDRRTAYDLPLDFPDLNGTEGSEITAKTGSREKSWGSRFYVVTAYPAGSVSEGTRLENLIQMYMEPVDTPLDGKDQYDSAQWNYVDYDWTYSGDMVGVEKESDKVNYIGWLDVYKQAKEKGEDYGSLPFTTKGVFRGYQLTHEINGSQEQPVGAWIEGKSCELTTVDDVMYLYPSSGEAQMLTGKDYYYSAVTITQKDVGYDVWEDRETAPESGIGDDIDRSVKIYAMYEDSEKTDIDEGWEPVGEIPWDTSGVMQYSFTQEQIQRKPWRVKAVHQTADYKTTCQIDVAVCFKKDSPALGKIISSGEAENPTIQIEDVSGVMGAEYTDGVKGRYCHETEIKGDNYKEPGLKEATEKLYGILLQRDNVMKDVSWLGKEAFSYKTSKAVNDANNSRVLVDYSLTAYDGYEIFGQDAVNYLKSKGMNSPGRNHVVFYDLLPTGIRFDPSYQVTAGRITNLANENYKTQPKSWDTSQTTVTVDSKRDIIENYRGTGRTMVVFHIEYEGADSAVFTNKRWIEGWGVNFRAYYDWKDQGIVKDKANVSAFMPEDKEGEPLYGQPLCGQETEVSCDDGVIVPKSLEKECKIFGSDINEDRITGIRNVLYAQNVTNEDTAQASESGIEKLVRADSDRFGVYSESAAVETGGGYTYSIAVKAVANELKNIVVYDHLENAQEDRDGDGDLFEPFEHSGWQGTFQSVDVAALKEMGIAPVIYYSTDRNVSIPEDASKPENGTAQLTSENGWYCGEDALALAGISKEAVQSIAVDLSHTEGGGEFILKSGATAVFQIKMTAPEEKPENAEYTYNNPAWFSEAVGTGDKNMREGNSVRVSLRGKEALEIVKEFGGDVPEAVRDTAFEFRLSEAGQISGEKPLANREYQLYKKSPEGDWIRQENRMYATDGGGRLRLNADEKAVFEELPSAGSINVREIGSLFWESESDTAVTEADGRVIRTVTVTNTYRPVLYVQKYLEGVPEGALVADSEFTFQVNAGGSPLAEARYCYVDSVRTDGGAPEIDTSRGDKGYGKTDENGRFTIKKGEIIALFPGSVGTEYEVKELTGELQDWICRTDTVSGTLPVNGARAAITNIYKWKELSLTKELTHQDPEECTQEFTFRIEKVTGENQEPEAVKGNPWLLLNPDGTPSEEKGTLDEQGEFACACAGRTVVIQGLEAGKTYVVTEVETGIQELYRPVNGTQEVTMPVFSGSKELTVTNDYLKRPLSVTKTVVYELDDPDAQEAVSSKSFTMQVKVGEKPLINHPYTLTEKGVEVQPESGQIYQTDGDGKFTLKNGQTAVFKDAGLLGQAFEVVEMQDEDYPQLYPASEDGEAGGPGEPGAPSRGTFTGEGAEVSMINGSGNSLLLGKEYTGGDEKGREYIEELKKKVTWSEGDMDDPGESYFDYVSSCDRAASGKVQLTLEVKNQDGYFERWPFPANEEEYQSKAGVYVTVIDQLSGFSKNVLWPWQSSVWIEPWKTVVIEGLPGETEYIVTEDKESQHTIWSAAKPNQLEPGEGGLPMLRSAAGNQRGQLSSGLRQQEYYQVTQKSPADDQGIQGTVNGKPSAVIYNQVLGIGSQCTVDKTMVLNSQEVPENAKLVWRVEEYDGKGGWSPAENVSYLVFAGGKPASDRIQQTGADGRIVLHKSPVLYPRVRFTDERVYLNLYDKEKCEELLKPDGEKPAPPRLLRLVEVPEESDDAWGILAGYLSGDAESDIRDTDMAEEMQPLRGMMRAQVQHNLSQAGEYSMDVEPEKAVGFVNSNQSGYTVEIGKEMENRSDDAFTMLLRQILSTSKNPVTASGDIQESRPGSGIEYTVRSIETDQEIRKEVTGKNGEIQLRAGEYARLELPYDTQWTVSEDIKPNYELKALTGRPDDSSMLKKLGDNLMMITHLRAMRLEVIKDEDYLVYADEALDKNRFKVSVVYTDGTKKQLDADEFEFAGSIEDCKPGDTRTLGVTAQYEGTVLEGMVFVTISGGYTNLTKEDVKSGSVINGETNKTVNLKAADVTIPLYIMRDGVRMRVTGIENSAFENCGTLENLIISEGITGLGSYAFKGCTKLETVKIPESMKLRGNDVSVFAGCGNLSDLDLGGTGTIGGRMFENCEKLTNIKMSEKITAINSNAFYGCEELQMIRIPKGIEHIRNNVFHGCEKLSDIFILGSPAAKNVAEESGARPPCEASMIIHFYIAGPEGSVSNLPWGASDQSTVTWNWNPDNS